MLGVTESIAAAKLARAVFGPLPGESVNKAPASDEELVEAAQLLLGSASKRMQMSHGEQRLTTGRIREYVWRQS